MTIHYMKNAALSALTIAALTWAGSAQAASDYLLKIEGVPSESKVAGVGGGAAPHVKKEKWIELESVQLGAETTAAAGGVHVASGDVNGVKSPRDAASGKPLASARTSRSGSRPTGKPALLR